MFLCHSLEAASEVLSLLPEQSLPGVIVTTISQRGARRSKSLVKSKASKREARLLHKIDASKAFWHFDTGSFVWQMALFQTCFYSYLVAFNMRFSFWQRSKVKTFFEVCILFTLFSVIISDICWNSSKVNVNLMLCFLK